MRFRLSIVILKIVQIDTNVQSNTRIAHKNRSQPKKEEKTQTVNCHSELSFFFLRSWYLQIDVYIVFLCYPVQIGEIICVNIVSRRSIRCFWIYSKQIWFLLDFKLSFRSQRFEKIQKITFVFSEKPKNRKT